MGEDQRAQVGPDSEDALGPYELRGELGRGAMARVWRAWDPNLEREVAIKEPLFDPRLSADVLEDMERRFIREGRAAARLQHPGIVTVYAADVYGGRPAIVMELVEGAALGEILESGPLAPEAALDALDQLLDAIGYAHGKGVVHRDIKPDNVFVSEDGRVKLSDFGIAHLDGETATRATAVGTVLGTPGYMSPEQAAGSRVDARSDLFSIGVIGYEMLAGTRPFDTGDDTTATSVLYRIVHEPAPPLPTAAAEGLPVDPRPAIVAALSKDPADRPQTAADFKAMLHGCTSAPTARLSADARAAGLADAASGKGRARSKRIPIIAVALVGIAVLAVVLSGALSHGSTQNGAVSSTSPITSSSSSSGTDERLEAAEKAAREAEEKLKAAEAATREAEEKAKEEAEARERAEAEAANQAQLAEQVAQLSGGAESAFWGIWIAAARDRSEADAFADDARIRGFDAEVLVSTDWENLNHAESWYVVSAGRYASQESAEAALPQVQQAGYGDAYVKYSGAKE